MSAILTGILGGTFDPIHYGHLRVADYLIKQGIVSKIHFVPCLLPPHRRIPQAHAEHRMAMVRLAIADHPSFLADDIDFQRPTPSYMVDTLALLRQRQPKTPWCLILGMDALAHFNEWREWQKIPTLAHLIVVNRPGFHLPQAQWWETLLAGAQVSSPLELNQTLDGKILLVDMPPTPISATEIRSHFELAESKHLLPPAVLKYIEQHQLYKA